MCMNYQLHASEMDYYANVSLKNVLKGLCCETPWKDAIYWRLDCGTHQILAWEDGYVDSRKLENGVIDFKDANSVYYCPIEQTLADMSHCWFSLGEGIIGEVALVGQHKWIFPDKYELNLLYKLPEDWQRQFLAGIKTILFVPICNFGVLQLGSLHMVCEDHKLVAKIKYLFTGLYQGLGNAEYTPSHDFFAEISSSEFLPINPHNQPSFTHPVHFPLVTNIQLQTFDHNTTGFVWDSILVNPNEEPNFPDESSIISKLPFTPELDTHGVGLACLEENNRCLLESATPKGNIFESCLDEIGTSLIKETGTKHLLEDIITGNDSSEVKQSFNQLTNFSKMYLPESQIEGVQMPTPLPSSEYFLFDEGCLSVNEKNKMRNSGVLNQIQKRSKVRQDVQKRRPRDRQLIQNSIKELRELIPDGLKCSIDALLERTVKHMLFLKSVSKQAEKIKKTEFSNVKRAEMDENKQNSRLSGDMSQKENKADMGPLIVQDLDQPGNTLVEMMCMEYGNFLEIAKIMKGLQLPILTGVLENRSGKLWAHFVIEVTKGFQRMHIVWPLMHLLQRSLQSQAKHFS